jgi:hypothetical protein
MTSVAAPAVVPTASDTAGAGPEAEAACDMCRHPAAEHDQIAARYCDATRAHALSRGCICRP